MLLKRALIGSCCLTIAAIKACSGQTIERMPAKGFEPNPPEWPESVKIFRQEQSATEILKEIEETQDPYDEKEGTFTTAHHFTNRRNALLFAPGVYRGLDFQIGYYSQVAGLGTKPDDVLFTDCKRGPFVDALDKHVHPPHGLSLDTFWRSAENFASNAESMMWAVSQAAPLRRVHVQNDLFLHDGAAYASGGHIANSKIEGHVHFGGQQQYLSRNVEFLGGASGGAWSLVFSGCKGDLPGGKADDEGQSNSIVTVTHPKIRMEKPYVAFHEDGVRFDLRVPKPSSDVAQLAGCPQDDEEVRSFENVRLVSVHQSNPTDRIQEALDEGLDVVLAPGVFTLSRGLVMKHEEQVILGLGLATLVAPPDGTPCISVLPHIHGIRIAGIMLEASAVNQGGLSNHKSTLLQWGEEGLKDPGNARSPGGLFDIFCRVGGSSNNRSSVSVDTIMRLHSGNIVGDNLWLWRADHSELAPGETANYPHISPVFHQNEDDEARAETGLEVFGDNVTIYGLAVEHANSHQTVWHGDNGSVHFYQCELPYDATPSFGTSDYRGYLISESVHKHELFAPGVYSNFRNHAVNVSTAIEHPKRDNIQIVHPFTVYLDNFGCIQSVVNGQGDAADSKGTVARLSTVN